MSKGTILNAVAAVLLFPLPSTAQEQAGTRVATAEQELVAASQAVARAQTSFDLRTLDAMLAPGYVEVSPIGDVDERAEVLGFYTPEAKDAMLARGVKPLSVSLVEPRVRLYGDHAIVITRQDAELEINGEVQQRTFRAMHHFRKIDGEWMLQNAQYTPIEAESADEKN